MYPLQVRVGPVKFLGHLVAAPAKPYMKIVKLTRANVLYLPDNTLWYVRIVMEMGGTVDLS